MKTKSRGQTGAFVLRQGKCVDCGGFLIGSVSACDELVCANCTPTHAHLSDDQKP